MKKEDKEHVKKLIRKGFYKPGLTKETLNLSLGMKLDRIEKMLKWLVVHSLDDYGYFYSEGKKTYHFSEFKEKLPDISDILEEK